jgi:hypothetical protein
MTRQRDPWVALAPLAILGIISGLVYYLGFTRPFFLADYYQEPLLDVGKLTGRTPLAANWWAISWTLLFASYYLAFRICPTGIRVSAAFRRATLAIICVAAAVFNVCLIFIYPVTAADLYDQIFRGRITTHYARNTFLTWPSSFGDDPFLRYVAWNTEGSPYGPVWELFAAIPSKLAGDSLWNNLVFFKVLVVLAYGASIALTYLILRSWKPEWALRGTLFWAWNPLVVFEVAGNGHNDSIMVTCLLAAVYLLVQGRRLGVLPALMAGVLTKFIPALLVPIAAAALWRDRVRMAKTGASFWERLTMPPTPVALTADGLDGDVRTKMERRHTLSSREAFVKLAIGGVLALGLAVLLYAPFWQGPQTIGALGRQGLFTSSFPTVMVGLMERIWGVSTEIAQGAARNLSLALTAITAIALTLFVFFKGNARTPEERRALINRALTAFYEMLFIYLAFANLWFQPWYLMWLVALTAPLARYTNANRTVLFCIGGIVNYFVWDFLWLWNEADGVDNNVTAVLMVYFLPLFYTLYTIVKPLFDRMYTRGIPGVRERQEPREETRGATV